MSREAPGPVGVIGLGVVGGTIARAFEEAGAATRGFDRHLEIGRPEDLTGCPFVFLCVPSPPGEHGRLDLSEVWSAMFEVEPHLESDAVVAVKSTVPPGRATSSRRPFRGFALRACRSSSSPHARSRPLRGPSGS